MAATTVLIPAYNEQDHVGAVIKTVLEAGFPVIVAEDGSADATAQVAEAAGAKVVRLPQNRGKGGAVAYGLRHVETPLVMLLDADLTGLTPPHLEALLAPVRDGEADMSIGIFKGGRLQTDLAQRITPYLSGQRAFRTELLRQVRGLEGARYGIEMVLTQHAAEHKWRVKYVPLVGMGQVMKEKKRGFWGGVAHRLQMYREILRSWRRRRVS